MPPPDPCVMMLRKADQDAALAAKLADDLSVTDEHLGFFCQQAIEKAVKSVLSYRNAPYRRTHDLSELFELAMTRGVESPGRLVAERDAHAVRRRVPLRRASAGGRRPRRV